ISYLKLGRIEDAGRVLDRVSSEASLHSMGNIGIHGQIFPQIALAQHCLSLGDTVRALNVTNAALKVAEKKRLGLEQGAIYRILGEVHGAIGNRDKADTAFRRSLEVLDEIQSRFHLAPTLLASAGFSSDDNRQD